MSGLNNEIRVRIEAFVSELTDLVRRAALDSVMEALGGSGPATVTRPRPAKSSAVAAQSRDRGGKRSPEEIVRTIQLVQDHVQQNPGQGVEQIAKEIGLPTKELTLPIKKLVGNGSLVTEGQKRATKYYPASGEEAASAPARGTAGRRARATGKRPAAKAGRGRKRG